MDFSFTPQLSLSENVFPDISTNLNDIYKLATYPSHFVELQLQMHWNFMVVI